MLKKFFSGFFMFFLLMNGVANAATIDPRTKCAAKNGVMGYRMTAGSPVIEADYVIYFDNNESVIPSDCTTEVNGVIQELKAKSNDIETVLLFGSADALGGASVNAPLAQARVDTVRQMLDTAKIPTCELDGDGKPKTRCAQISMGDSFNRAVIPYDNTESTRFERSVYMFVIHKDDVCDASTLNILDTLISKVDDATIKAQLQTARNVCETEGQLLLRSQRQAIMDAIKAVIDRYPDFATIIPGNLSISILVASIQNARDALAVDASVWKDKDGKFNVARLASDSIAGVVLGTAGGLITSSVVKKSQIKKGFEDIMCTIGGQTVADYGDEFRVGIR